MKIKKVTEVSCYMENKPGVLGKVAGALDQEGIKIIGLHSYEGHLQNMTRFVLADKDLTKSEMILRSLGIDLITQIGVLEVLFQSKSGFIAKLTSLLGEAGINIQVMYFTESPDGATMAYITVSNTDKALEILEDANKTEAFSKY
ncbi:MAG: ACT domain-containing protein [Candidatus Gracilibacteria bacterium]|nr:ACT domain-containing protein [Candidatus Gracilibacteria bacterium]